MLFRSGRYPAKAAAVAALTLVILGEVGCKPKAKHSDNRTGDPTAMAAAADAELQANPPAPPPQNTAAKLAIAGPATLAVGACSPPVTITSMDPSGSPATVSATESPLAAVGAGSVQFFSDNVCSKRLTGLEFPGASTAMTVYMEDTATENLNIVFTIGDIVAPSLTLAVGPSS